MDIFLPLDLEVFIRSIGLVGVFAVIFAESGLLIGFFLPGDSLLFTAGFLSSQGYISLPLLIAATFLAAVLGDNLGYSLGRKFGPRVFESSSSRLFHKENLLRVRSFFERYGGMAIIFARFLPFARTFAPVLAGVGEMRYASFFFYNISGGILWAIGLPLLGFWLGNAIPNVDQYLLPILAAVIVITSLPGIIQMARMQSLHRRLAALFRSMARRRP